MVKASFGQFWNGKYYTKGQAIPANEKQAKELVKCGRAYTETKPTDKNTVAQIKEYLDKDGISYEDGMTKAQLLELC